MAKQIIHTDQAPAAIGPYSQAVRAGNTVYFSGQIPLDPATGNLVDGSSGICPEKYTVLPARTACEYGPIAAGARSVWMICLAIGNSCRTGVDSICHVPAGVRYRTGATAHMQATSSAARTHATRSP